MASIRVICEASGGIVRYTYPDAADDKFGRKLTGIHSASNSELYSELFQNLEYGRHRLRGPVGPNFDINDGATRRAEILAERVNLARKWVAECDARDSKLAGDATAELDKAGAAAAAVSAGRTILFRRPDGAIVEI